MSPKYPNKACLLSAAEAKALAQRIAFGPLAFQAVCALGELGLFKVLWATREPGVSIDEAARETGLSRYAVTVVFEAAMGADVLDVSDDRFRLSKVGYFLHRDDLTRVNLAFVRDICYRPALSLTASLREGLPRGLPELFPRRGQQGASADVEALADVGAEASPPPTGTLYEALLSLPEPALKSWLDFDHFYSDRSFDQALDIVLRGEPRRILDVGANTGRFAGACLARSPQAEITLVDHPAQLRHAERRLLDAGWEGRFLLAPVDLLGAGVALPVGMDAVWLSQLLDCFSEERVQLLLEKSREALGPEGRVFVLEPCWDRQPQASGTYCLLQTSLYFTCVANGESRMYDSVTLGELIERAGLVIEQRHDGLGVGHSLFVCRAATRPELQGRA